jgi:hypothetical protein
MPYTPFRTSLLVTLPLLALASCTYNGDPKPAAATTRPGEPIMKDPLEKWTNFDPNRRDVSGGGINNYNRDAMKRDVDNTVFLK